MKFVSLKSKEKEAINSVIGQRTTASFLDIVADMVNGLPSDIVECPGKLSFMDMSHIYQSIGDDLIYTDDKWEVMKHYCNPEEASFENAFEDLFEDICEIVKYLKN